MGLSIPFILEGQSLSCWRIFQRPCMILTCALKLSICAKGAQCYLHTKSAITFLFYVLNIYKLVNISTFDCYDTIAFIHFSTFLRVVSQLWKKLLYLTRYEILNGKFFLLNYVIQNKTKMKKIVLFELFLNLVVSIGLFCFQVVRFRTICRQQSPMSNAAQALGR